MFPLSACFEFPQFFLVCLSLLRCIFAFVPPPLVSSSAAEWPGVASSRAWHAMVGGVVGEDRKKRVEEALWVSISVSVPTEGQAFVSPDRGREFWRDWCGGRRSCRLQRSGGKRVLERLVQAKKSDPPGKVYEEMSEAFCSRHDYCCRFLRHYLQAAANSENRREGVASPREKKYV